MAYRCKLAFLYCCKYLGLFGVARLLTRRELRVLCYHGFSFRDEHAFRPKLFMRPETFARRMALLAARGHQVLPLGEALDRLDRGTLPDAAVAITVDDGWYGFLRFGAPELARRNFPATVYLTTYYAEKQAPIFKVLVEYLFWSSTAATLDLDGLADGLGGQVDLADPAARGRARDAVIECGDERLDARARTALAHALAGRLGLDPAPIAGLRMFELTTLDEAKQYARYGIDVQLHTHTHRISADDRAAAEAEVMKNRALLSAVTDAPIVHFCYPSGLHHPRQYEWLRALGIVSATTTVAGLHYPGEERMAVARLIDGEDVTDIEFEAELAGLGPLLRRTRRAVADAG
ncbi:MAG: polysaccharide deacetylase family protein [Alphaproteobacteria bacterium]|nr:polysaccharide deacetylase family protein [Alphaproteobacteria bacterium]